MSKRPRKPRNQNKNSNKKPDAKKLAARADAKRRKLIMNSVKGVAALLAVGAVSVAGAKAYKGHWAEMTDLSVIGNGVPTVVQVHDPGCKLCRALKSSTTAALGKFDDKIQYRIAEIGTPKGRAFASEHGVQHVTLVTFTGTGKVVNTLQGVRKADELSPYFERLVKREAAIDKKN